MKINLKSKKFSESKSLLESHLKAKTSLLRTWIRPIFNIRLRKEYIAYQDLSIIKEDPILSTIQVYLNLYLNDYLTVRISGLRITGPKQFNLR